MKRVLCQLPGWSLSLLLLMAAACGDDGGGGSGGGGGSDTGGADGAGGIPTVHLNEVMPVNDESVTDPFDEQDDWIELYNPGAATASLNGFFISDDIDEPRKWRLPAELTIPPGGILLLWADKTPEQGPDHLPFGLSGGAEVVILSDPSGTELERVQWSGAAADQVYARFPDGTGDFVACDRPTPGEPNGSACGE